MMEVSNSILLMACVCEYVYQEMRGENKRKTDIYKHPYPILYYVKCDTIFKIKILHNNQKIGLFSCSCMNIIRI